MAVVLDSVLYMSFCAQTKTPNPKPYDPNPKLYFERKNKGRGWVWNLGFRFFRGFGCSQKPQGVTL